MLKPETTTIIDGKRRESGLTYYRKTERQDFFPYTHNHEFYELSFVKSGKIVHYVNNSREVLMPGTMLFIRPDDTHRFMPLNSNPYDFINICISYEIMDDITKYLGIEIADLHRKSTPLKRIYPNSQCRYIMSILTQLMNLIDSDLPDEDVLKCAKAHMAHFVYSLATMDNSGRIMPSWLRKVTDEMKKPENFVPGYDRMLELADCSPAHLSREMKVFFDMSPTEYVGRQRVTLALQMFKEGETDMNRVYKTCGFGSLSNFYLVFKKTMGQNPGEYIRSLE